MLKKKNFLYFFIIFLITIIFTILFFQIKQNQENLIIQSLEKQSYKIDTWILKKKIFLEKLSKNLEKIDYNKETYLKLMKETNKQMLTHSIFSGFNTGKYIDTQGYWIDNFDPRKRPWYIETLKNKNTTISGPMYYNDISGQRIAWWSISSILLKDNKPFGVVSSEILPDMIIEQLNEINIKDIERFFLFHKQTGTIVSSIDRDLELKYIQDIFSEEIFEKLTKKHIKTVFSTNNKSKVAYTSSLKEAPWILCIIKNY